MMRSRRLLSIANASRRLFARYAASAALLLLVATALLPARADEAAAIAKPLEQIKATDVEGKLHLLGQGFGVKAVALVFLSPECPIACKYIPELNRLVDDLTAQAEAAGRVEFYGVVADPSLTRAAALRFARDYRIAFPLLFDASLDLARRFRPTHVPEAFVLNTAGEVLYRGRIDDRYAGLGKPRAQVSEHSLASALTAALAGRPIEPGRTEVVGCRFEALAEGKRPAPITFCRDIAPLLWNNCVGCHRLGEVAPFALATYADAAKRAAQLAEVAASRYMPPWKAEPAFHHFVDERRLADDEIARLAAWAEAGAPEGNVDDLPPLPSFSDGWKLGEPDLVLKMPEPFQIPADGPNIFRWFAIPINVEGDREVAAVEIRAGNRRVVHHTLTFLDVSGMARRLDAEDPLPGYERFGNPGFPPIGFLGSWGPGMMPQRLPEGLGIRVFKGSVAVMQMHYVPSGKPESDQSLIGLHFVKKPGTRPVTNIPVINTDFAIPPGESHFQVVAKFKLPVDVTVLSVTPHMHYLGREMKVAARLPDGSQSVPLISIKDWDFDWQAEYHFVEPIRLPKGAVIEVEAYYDNTSGNPRNPNPVPKLVKHGQQTTDEMCLCGVQIGLDRLGDFVPLAGQMIQQFVKLKDGKIVIVPLE